MRKTNHETRDPTHVARAVCVLVVCSCECACDFAAVWRILRCRTRHGERSRVFVRKISPSRCAGYGKKIKEGSEREKGYARAPAHGSYYYFRADIRVTNEPRDIRAVETRSRRDTRDYVDACFPLPVFLVLSFSLFLRFVLHRIYIARHVHTTRVHGRRIVIKTYQLACRESQETRAGEKPARYEVRSRSLLIFRVSPETSNYRGLYHPRDLRYGLRVATTCAADTAPTSSLSVSLGCRIVWDSTVHRKRATRGWREIE